MGHIEKRTRNRGVVWRARYRAPDGSERSKSFARKVDAEQYLARVEAQKSQGAWVDPALGRLTVADWSSEWLASKRKLKPKTREGYESLLRSRILPGLGSAPLNRLRRVDVEAWVTEMVDDGLSPSRVRQAFNVLGAMIDAAIANGMLARNVARGIELPRLKRTERLFLTAEQVATLAENMPEQYEALVYVLAYGGLRWGEAVAMRRSRCELLRRRLVVAEAVSTVRGELVWGTPKTHQLGAVSLPPFVCDVLARHLASRVPADPDALVFTTNRDAPLRHSNFMRRVWYPVVELADVPDRITPHGLRHTCAALLIAQGADPKAVQTQMRHSSIQVTFDIYGHLLPGHMDDVMERLDAEHRIIERGDIVAGSHAPGRWMALVTEFDQEASE